MDLAFRRTKQAVYWGAVLGEPLAISMFLLKPILSRDFGATHYQLALFNMLKHAVTLFSVYGSLWALNKRDRLRPQLIWTGVVLRLPFLLFAWITNTWWALLAVGIHMLVGKAGNPAWFETMRLNLPKEERTRIYAASSAICCIEGLFLGWGAKRIMHQYPESWRYLIPLSAVVGLLALRWIWRIPIPEKNEPVAPPPLSKKGGHNGGELLAFFAAPWKTAITLIKERPDFRIFQLGYLICGGGILLFQPLMPNFCVRELNITDYSSLIDIFSIYLSVGFAISMYSWNRSLHLGLFKASSLVCLFFGLHILLLIAAQLCHGHHIFQKDAPKFLLCAAQVIYGVGMGGSHVLWNMSPTIFCREGEDSSIYTTTNMISLGVRAITMSLLGAYLCVLIGYLYTLFISGFCCLLGGAILAMYAQTEKNPSISLAKK